MYNTKRILRGQIYYVNKTGKVVGSEQKSGRPAIIVSNDTGNFYSNLVEVVYLTTKEKTNLPTHVEILSARYPSIALCEEIVSVDKSRLGKYLNKVSKTEMQQIDRSILIGLGIIPENILHLMSNYMKEYDYCYSKIQTTQEEFIRAQAERDVYKKLYGDLLTQHFAKEIPKSPGKGELSQLLGNC